VHLTTAEVGILGDAPAGLAYCPAGSPDNGQRYVPISGNWFQWVSIGSD
jgi:hypothetical protein